MLLIKNFRIKKEDREVGKKQYMYYRVEGNGNINNGTTSQKERYSTKTMPKEEYWYDVSSFMATGLIDRPDDVFHKWLSKNKRIHSINEYRDLFRPKDLPLQKFEEYLIEYAEEQLNQKPNNPLKLREYQKEGAQFLINFIKSNYKKCLFEAIPGYGKTFTLYYSILEAKTAKKIAIVTSRCLVNDAFIKDFREQNLAAKGYALKVRDSLNEFIEGNWDTAEYRIIAAPAQRNSLFKEFLKDPNCLWVQDEAHLGGSSKKSEKFYKNKKVIFITGTGNKLFDKVETNYFFGISEIVNAIKYDPSLKVKFPIPSIKLVEKFADLDFGMLKNADKSKLEELLNDIVEKSLDNPDIIKNGIIKVGGRYSASAYKLYKVARITHPEISWYLSADGNNSKSADDEGNELKGPEAIHRFDKDCENEPNKTHILITHRQGQESYSYYDLYNIFYLSESSSPESFIQTLCRLDRPKKHSNSTTADFYMYSPFVNFLYLISGEYERGCKRTGKQFNIDEFTEFIRIFNVTTDITELPKELTATYALELLSIRSELIRNCPKEDLIILSNYINEIKNEDFKIKNTNLFGESKKIVKPNKTNKANKSSGSHKATLEKKEETKVSLELKQKVELLFNRLPFYCKYLEYCKSNGKFIEELKDYEYPKNIKQLRKLPICNFKELVCEFKDEQIISKLFNSLSDIFMENVLKRMIAIKDKNLEDLPYNVYSPYKNNKKNVNSRIKRDVFDTYFLPKIDKSKLNGKTLVIRSGLDSVLSLKELGFSDITYYTDIFAEKVIFDYYNIPCKYIEQLSREEDWVKVLKDLNMKLDLIIMNPPYSKNLHLKILAEAIKHISNNGEVVNLSPVRWLQDPLAKDKKNNDYHRFEQSISKHIKDLEVIDAVTSQKIFEGSAIFTSDLGIYTCDKTGGFNYSGLVNPIIEKILKIKSSLGKPTIELNKKDGWRVRIPKIVGGKCPGSGLNRKVSKNKLGKLLYFYEGKKDGKFWYEFYMKNQHSKTIPEITDSIKFNTEEEVKNFCNLTNNTFFNFVEHNIISDSNVSEDKILWLDNAIRNYYYDENDNKIVESIKGYNKPWTNHDLCDYFGITGYISNTKATPGSEWEEILNFMDQYI